MPMTEAEWLACDDPHNLREHVEARASPRKLRLFGAACCRTVWDLLVDERSPQAVEAMVGLLAVWGTESPGRAAYDKIQAGMSQDEVDAIVCGRSWLFEVHMTNLRWHTIYWRAANGATVNVTFDSDGRVTGKSFDEGDQSLTGRLKRLAGRLPLP
jgi:hypothetical protein